jgi:hypothetical protein
VIHNCKTNRRGRTYTANCNPSLKVVGLQISELLVQRDIRFRHWHDLECSRMKEYESIEQMTQARCVDLPGPDLVTLSLARVPALTVSERH